MGLKSPSLEASARGRRALRGRLDNFMTSVEPANSLVVSFQYNKPKKKNERLEDTGSLMEIKKISFDDVQHIHTI